MTYADSKNALLARYANKAAISVGRRYSANFARGDEARSIERSPEKPPGETEGKASP